jgi:hypothetical protein
VNNSNTIFEVIGACNELTIRVVKLVNPIYYRLPLFLQTLTLLLRLSRRRLLVSIVLSQVKFHARSGVPGLGKCVRLLFSYLEVIPIISFTREGHQIIFVEHLRLLILITLSFIIDCVAVPSKGITESVYSVTIKSICLLQ